jgi:hypothetical protein
MEQTASIQHTPFSKALMRAFDGAYKKTQSVLERNVTQLNDRRVIAKLRADIDYMPDTFRDQLIIDRVEESGRILKEDVAAKSHDAVAFINNCAAFVENEIEILLYRTNDPVSAKMSKDYFHDFVQESIKMLGAKNPLTDKQIHELYMLVACFEDGIETYDALKEHLLKNTEGNHGGLIGYVLEEQPGYVMDAEAQKWAVADDRILGESYAALQKILREEVVVSENTPEYLPPQLILITKLVDKIAIERVANRQGGVFDWTSNRDNDARNAEGVKELRHAITLLNTRNMFEGTTAAIEYLRATLKEERKVPDDFAQIVQQAIEAAQRAAHKTSLTVPVTPNNPYLKSKWITGGMALGTKLRAKIQHDSLIKSISEVLSDCQSMSDIVSVTNEIAEDMGMMMLREGHEPSIVDVAHSYMQTLRLELGKKLDKSGFSNKSALFSIQQDELMLQMMGQSVKIAKEWLFNDTGGKWDSYYAQAVAQYSVDSCIEYGAMKHHDFDKIGDMAYGRFIGALGERNMTGDSLIFAMTPFLYERAYDVAQMRARMQDVSKDKGGEQRLWGDIIKTDPVLELWKLPDGSSSKKSDKISKEAVKILREAVNALPREVDSKGKKLKPSLDSVASVISVAYNLMIQLEQIPQRANGRMH